MHDQNFKNLILDYPRQALEFFAGEEAGDLTGARLLPIRQEQLQERLGERFRELDTPLLVEWPDGRREALLFVIEEESDARRFSIHRLAHYCLDLSELMATERVVPVVIFLRRGPHPSCLRLGGDRHVYLDFRYLCCDLQTMPAEEHQNSANIVARLNLPNMHYPPDQRLAVYAAAQTGLILYENDLERQLKYADFIDYYANLSDDEIDAYRQQYFTERGNIMGLAQILRQEGRTEGMQQGEAKLLLRLLEKRFGPLPEAKRALINAADADTLLQWSDKLLTADSIEAVFNG